MQHNVFISYAWVDNEVYPGDENGWVSTFLDGLRKHLARELGRKDEAGRIWLDYEQLRGNEPLTPTIREHLEASRTLVLILSNGYLASPWCRQELAAFVDKFGTESGRIFTVEMSPVDEKPEALRDLLKYTFWYPDEAKQPLTRWLPHIDGTDREYPREQQRLARDLAAKLRGLDNPEAQQRNVQPTSGSNHEPIGVEKPAPMSQPRATSPSRAAANPFVLVNGGAEDRDLVYNIAKRLEQHQFGIAIPLSAVADQSGVKSSVITRDLRTKLSLCDCVLMVYQHGPVDQVSHHLVECLKACTKTPKGKTPPSIDLCQTKNDSLALGLHAPGMRIHIADESCVEDCVGWFLDGISP